MCNLSAIRANDGVMRALADTEAELRALMLLALTGDAVAYRRLLDALRRLLGAYFARRLGGGLAAHADDLVQETLLAIHTRRMTYETTEPLTAWVYAIARYKLIDFYRRSKLRVSVPLDDDLPLAAPDESSAAADALDVETVLGALPARQAALMREVKLEGHSIAEAASRQGMSETAAKVSIHRGLKALAARFAGGSRDE